MASKGWPLEADTTHYAQAASLCLQLWQQGSLSAKQADSLFGTLPALKGLLQPIQSCDVDSAADAYCLTDPLLTAKVNLSDLGEWQLALLGLNETVRAHWLNLAAARCREAGSMNEPQVLVDRIDQLGNASEWVLAYLENSDTTTDVSAGPLAALERELIGHSLNENAAIPALCRILCACFTLQSSVEHSSFAPITSVDLSGKALANNWCAGRLLALPTPLLNESELVLKLEQQWLLMERPLTDTDAPLIEQFNHQPWLFLLSLLAFVQDAWAAEQRGGLLLALANGQQAYAPTQIEVVIQGVEGDEVSLGTLADFFVQLLAELHISLYPTLPDTSALNRALSPLVTKLLTDKLWQFKDGGRGEYGQYTIHPDFSDACYSLPLAPLFGYKSAVLQQAIKQCAQNARAAKKIII